MSIQAEDVRVTYDCDGSTVDFAFEFKIFSEDDIDVILTDSGGTATTLTITTDYTVEGENGAFESGGTVTTVKEVDGEMVEYAWAEGYTITIVLNLPLSQETSLPYGGTLPSASIINALDKLTKICQQLNDAIKRSVTLATDSPLSSLTIPDLVAGRYLYASDAETLGWATSVDTTAITVSDFAKTFLDDLDASAVLTTLGISTFIKTLLDDTTSATALKTLLSAFHTSVAKTANYTVTAADRGKLITFDCTTGNLVCDLPAAATAGNGFMVAIKKTDSSANYLTLDPAAAELVDGAGSKILRYQNNYAVAICDGTGWNIISVSSELLGSNTFTDHGILLGSGTGAITPTAAMTDGQLLVGQTSSDPLPKTLTGDVTISAAGATTIGASKVSQAKLKTSTSTTSSSHDSGTSGWSLLSGGEYGFTPQAKGNDANMNFAYGIDKGTLGGDGDMQSASYVGPMIHWEWARTDQMPNHTFYLQQRFVTSSGEVNWLFVLRDKITKKIIMASYSSEHPCFGQGGDPEAMPHPWVMGKPKYDPDIHEVLVANPTDEMVMQILSEHPEYDSFLEAIHEGVVEIDELSRPAWPKKEVTVGLPKGTDWKRMPDGTPVTPIKKVIPKPDGVTIKSLRKKL